MESFNSTNTHDARDKRDLDLDELLRYEACGPSAGTAFELHPTDVTRSSVSNTVSPNEIFAETPSAPTSNTFTNLVSQAWHLVQSRAICTCLLRVTGAIASAFYRTSWLMVAYTDYTINV